MKTFSKIALAIMALGYISVAEASVPPNTLPNTLPNAPEIRILVTITVKL